MSTFHPPEKWVALNKWLGDLDSLLATWAKVKQEAEQCLSNS